MENYLFYSQLVLLILGFASFALSVLFRLRLKALKNIASDGLVPNVFNKSFVIFNPYSEHRKILHKFLSFLPLIVLSVSTGLVLALFALFEAGFLLSFCVVLVGLNLVVIEDAFDAYGISKVFIVAMQRRTKLGVGDLKVLQLIKGFMPRISNYYLGLSVILLVLSIVFQSLVPYAMWLVSRYVDLVLQASMAYEPVSYLMSVFLFSLSTVFIQILSSVIKGRIFKYSVELLHA